MLEVSNFPSSDSNVSMKNKLPEVPQSSRNYKVMFQRNDGNLRQGARETAFGKRMGPQSCPRN